MAFNDTFGTHAGADGDLLFLDFSAGYPGSMHDTHILRNSSLYQKAEQGDILTGPIVNVKHYKIGLYLVGDCFRYLHGFKSHS